MKFFNVFITLVATVITGASSLSAAPSPQLVKDIFTAGGSVSSSPANFCAVGDILFFTATDTSHGTELWKSDGTVAGTVMVRDIHPGTTSSNPANLIAYNGALYFQATSPATGRELWKSDGTEAGTVLVKDMFVGPTSSTIFQLMEMNGILYFQASDAAAGRELWRSDGTTAGTMLVKDINPGSLDSFPNELTAIGNTLYFLANDGVNGGELWKSDGTEAGTVLVKDIVAGSSGSQSARLTVMNGMLYFQSFEPAGFALWKSNGTAAGTERLAALGISVSTPMVAMGNAIYFSANDGLTGIELWKSDGTTAGTGLLKDLNPTTSVSDFRALQVVGTTLYVVAYSNSSGGEHGEGYLLWKSDGTTAGTVVVKDTFGPQPLSNLQGFGSTLYFSISDGFNGQELWKSNGTSAGTVMVADINPGTASSTPGPLTAWQGALYFAATDAVHGTELWRTDGTSAGTEFVADIRAGTGNASPVPIAAIGNTLFFNATDGAVGNELWKTDGTEAGTVLVKDINAGTSSGSPSQGMVLGGLLYFQATTVAAGGELWKSDGTGANTALLKDIFSGTSSGDPRRLTPVENTIFFTASDTSNNGTELWKTDGTTAGTVLVKNINLGSFSTSSPNSLTALGGLLLFSASDGTNGNELWKSDGTTAGTVMVKNINSGSSSSNPGAFAIVGNTLFFAASDGTNGSELWKTDGTAAGTVLVKDIRPGSTGSSITSPSAANAVIGGTLYFRANDGTHGEELWKSDGTAAGTVLVKDIVAGSGNSTPNDLTAVGNTLFFTASDGANGVELWKSDGTEAGTVLVKDILPGSGNGLNALDARTTALGRKLYFVANDGVHGDELWESDGTEAGTQMVADLTGDSGSSAPTDFFVVGSKLYFTAFAEATGKELYVFEPPAEPDIQVEAPLNNILVSGGAAPSYGLQPVDGGIPFGVRHRITNTGQAPLTGLALTITGGAAADFTPSELSPATLAPGASFEFDVVFDATTAGQRTATLSLASDDPDENPFVVPLSGLGLTAQQAWRLQYFLTIDSTGNAADSADPDGDGASNFFEFVAGLIPNDPASRFQVRVEDVPDQPGQKAITFGPVIAGRTYSVKSKTNLVDATWVTLTNITTTDNGPERTVTDLDAGSGPKFYEVEVTKP